MARLGQCYVLKLTGGRWYVGYTEKGYERIQAHEANRGAKWTKKYRPVKPIPYSQSEPGKSTKDENKLTLQYMKKYGISNVRGGDWCMLKMSSKTIKELEKLTGTSKQTSVMKCGKCGREGHNRTKCYAKSTVDGVKITTETWKYRPKTKKSTKKITNSKKKVSKKINPKVVCKRCNRIGHESKNCRAKTIENLSGAYGGLLEAGKKGLPRR